MQSNQRRLFDEELRIPQAIATMNWLGILLVMVSTSVAVLAQTNAPEVRKLSLEDCLQSALRKNLDLQIARYIPPLATLDLQAAYAGYDPNFAINPGSPQHSYSKSPGSFDPTTGTVGVGRTATENDVNTTLSGLSPWGTKYSLSGDYNNAYGTLGSGSGTFDQYNASAGITVSQPLLKNFWIDSTRLNILVFKNRLKYSELTLKNQIMQTATTVETAYYDLIYDRENVTVQEKAVELATQLVVENRKRVEVGALAPLDAQQAEAQAASTEATLIAAKSALAVQEHLVKQLITDQYSQWADLSLVPSGSLTASRQFFSRQDSWSKGLSQRPDLLQAKLDVEKQGITIKFTYNQLYPELDLVGSYGQNAFGFNSPGSAFDNARDGTYPQYSYGAMLSFPIGNTGARANYKSSKLVKEQLLLTLKKLEQTIMVEIDNDIKQGESNFKQVAATRTAREYAAAALDAEQKKLESGKSTTYTVLQMQRDLTLARGNEILALDNYNKALAQLSVDEGSTLQRLAINLEVK
jgi:HAE1 family hydrophobic/amphiphilic exporter-1